MTDPYHIALEQARQQWRASSIVLQSQISDLSKLADRLKTPWMADQLHNQIDFLIDLNNSIDDYVEQSTQMIRLQRFQTGILNETIQAYATQDTQLFSTLIRSLKK